MASGECDGCGGEGSGGDGDGRRRRSARALVKGGVISLLRV